MQGETELPCSSNEDLAPLCPLQAPPLGCTAPSMNTHIIKKKS